MGRRGERHPGESVVAGGSEEAERVPAVAPRVDDATVGVEDHEWKAPTRQEVTGGQARLTTSDNNGMNMLDSAFHDTGPHQKTRKKIAEWLRTWLRRM